MKKESKMDLIVPRASAIGWEPLKHCTRGTEEGAERKDGEGEENEATYL